ncbi:hypothetical protein BMR1_01G01212 [Babesia microti strain RI]|uniref:Uncharacterized protein n=1 Tax=Babesia microti (strain RI) TaxID=1133968 RepID=A0A1N6LWL4_BABMR|nr:hypothetical protein BMR1_01G01212 [Babesia microti strain RI]SIO73263.1 hypothetical protein BMR1_01G01212 [Babesia microti strain RI]|eukprot:XP_021337368.1 hypothetical protein BMR1_01G01212 [Babesia microti strain RI]
MNTYLMTLIGGCFRITISIVSIVARSLCRMIAYCGYIYVVRSKGATFSTIIKSLYV